MDNAKVIALVMNKKYKIINPSNELAKVSLKKTEVLESIRSSNINPDHHMLEINIKTNKNAGETPDELIDSIVNDRENKKIYESKNVFTSFTPIL
jgi:hypothetical protein